METAQSILHIPLTVFGIVVVDKIETVETKDGRTFTIDMHMDSVLIFEYALTTNEIVFTEGQGRFKNLYNACIQFVKWFNKQI